MKNYAYVSTPCPCVCLVPGVEFSMIPIDGPSFGPKSCTALQEARQTYPWAVPASLVKQEPANSCLHHLTSHDPTEGQQPALESTVQPFWVWVTRWHQLESEMGKEGEDAGLTLSG